MASGGEYRDPPLRTYSNVRKITQFSPKKKKKRRKRREPVSIPSPNLRVPTMLCDSDDDLPSFRQWKMDPFDKLLASTKKSDDLYQNISSKVIGVYKNPPISSLLLKECEGAGLFSDDFLDLTVKNSENLNFPDILFKEKSQMSPVDVDESKSNTVRKSFKDITNNQWYDNIKDIDHLNISDSCHTESNDNFGNKDKTKPSTRVVLHCDKSVNTSPLSRYDSKFDNTTKNINSTLESGFSLNYSNRSNSECDDKRNMKSDFDYSKHKYSDSNSTIKNENLTPGNDSYSLDNTTKDIYLTCESDSSLNHSNQSNYSDNTIKNASSVTGNDSYSSDKTRDINSTFERDSSLNHSGQSDDTRNVKSYFDIDSDQSEHETVKSDNTIKNASSVSGNDSYSSDKTRNINSTFERDSSLNHSGQSDDTRNVKSYFEIDSDQSEHETLKSDNTIKNASLVSRNDSYSSDKTRDINSTFERDSSLNHSGQSDDTRNVKSYFEIDSDQSEHETLKSDNTIKNASLVSGNDSYSSDKTRDINSTFERDCSLNHSGQSNPERDDLDHSEYKCSESDRVIKNSNSILCDSKFESVSRNSETVRNRQQYGVESEIDDKFVTLRKSSNFSVKKVETRRNSIILRPGKQWERSLNIVKNCFGHLNDTIDLNNTTFTGCAPNKGRNYKKYVEDVLRLQNTSVLADITFNPNVTHLGRKSVFKIVKETDEGTDLLASCCNDTELAFSRLSVSRRDEEDALVKENPLEDWKDYAKNSLLRRCGQNDYLNFDDCYSKEKLRRCWKIGEGAFGEVFIYKEDNETGGDRIVMKVIPIEGETRINGSQQKKFSEIVSEIIISMELSDLRNNTKYNTRSFVKVHRAQCVQGYYPDHLLDQWEYYDGLTGSYNDNPDIFGPDQLYVVLELEHGGKDLESFQFFNAEQSYALFFQIAFSLAVAEEALQFEHRDLHWGNVLVKNTDEENINFVINNESYSIKSGGVQGTIIDFTLSRIFLPQSSCVLYCDLSQDDELFAAGGDCQFDVYRSMKEFNGNSWYAFNPYSNILWLRYILDKMIKKLHYEKTRTRLHKHYIEKLKTIEKTILNYDSCYDFVTNAEQVMFL